MARAMTAGRRAVLAANLLAVRDRIAAAARAAGRAPEEITLVAVSKTFPAQDVAALLDLGVTDFGENRDQEAAVKVAEVAALRATAGPVPRWHFVGQVQRKKAGSVASYADVVHSVDRPGLADALGRGAAHGERELEVLLQVSLDDDDASAGRAGVAPDRVVELAEHVLGVPRLRLAGVMGLAPREGDAAVAFARLAHVAAQVRSLSVTAVVVSAGMSGDLEVAVAHGSTLVRVGTALFGDRAIKSEHGLDGPPGD